MIRACIAFSLMLSVGCAPAPESPAPGTAAVDPTATDIWMAEIARDDEGIVVGAPVNLTERDGYDNQPHFLPGGDAFLYTSISEGGQADIRRYSLVGGRTPRVTHTPESEYSPIPMSDGGFAVVRVEEGGRQRLWSFDADGTPRAPVIESIEPVGYHAWFDDGRVALFVLGEPPTLVIADVVEGAYTEALVSIGRSLQAIPGREAVSVVHKVAEDEWNLVAVDPAGEVTFLAPALAPSEDHAWTPAGELLMARGSTLYHWNTDIGAWRAIVDLSESGVGAITRLAVSPDGDRILMVGQR